MGHGAQQLVRCFMERALELGTGVQRVAVFAVPDELPPGTAGPILKDRPQILTLAHNEGGSDRRRTRGLALVFLPSVSLGPPIGLRRHDDEAGRRDCLDRLALDDRLGHASVARSAALDMTFRLTGRGRATNALRLLGRLRGLSGRRRNRLGRFDDPNRLARDDSGVASRTSRSGQRLAPAASAPGSFCSGVDAVRDLDLEPLRHNLARGSADRDVFPEAGFLRDSRDGKDCKPGEERQPQGSLRRMHYGIPKDTNLTVLAGLSETPQDRSRRSFKLSQELPVQSLNFRG
ncbi:hypothetical protein BOSEA31B_20031 [Hyphomicrobiales bacterium]|nr:hypothetical protein BOSEA31B_20031 [Hyphomicrobiales bacterium]CAH1702597.1 hypothetical protein BOSEA1005_30469 [Hyphomicrobiales bacterium]CAI0346800.1 hypothetical protein BO1005MUT1_520312 [Hyphomicrobiales bacterium]